MAHIGMDNLDFENTGDGWSRARAILADGDTADNPASTKRLIQGPAGVEYVRAPDGGLNVYVNYRPLTKRAADLKPGDKIQGYTFPYSLYSGTVKSAVSDPTGSVRIELEPSGHYFVDAEREIQVIA